MTRIFFNGGLIWDKSYLPNEQKAELLLRTYAGRSSPEAAEALSAGIDTKIGGNWFKVELNNDKSKRTVTTA